MVGGGVVLLTGRLVWLGKWARGVAAEGGRRATVVALAVAAAGVAPVKNAGNQSGEGMPSGPRKRRVPRAVRGWGGQEGGDTLRGGNTIKIHRSRGPAGRWSTGREQAMAVLDQVLTEVHEPHMFLQRPPHAQGPAPGHLELPEQGPAHVGRPEGCGWGGATLSVVEPRVPLHPPRGTRVGAHWDQSALPQWPGLSCLAPSPVGGHFGSPS